MSLHDPDQSPSLDEIESHAAVAVHLWLGEAIEALDERFGTGYAEKHAPAVAGFMSACAIYYQAERMVDAADMIRRELSGLDDAIRESRDSVMIERLAGVENELYRLANTAGDAFMTWTDPARKRGRGDGRK